MPGGFYRWHLNEFQMTKIRDVPDDRWRALKLDASLKPWRSGGDKILIADTLDDYWLVRGLSTRWSYETATSLRKRTARPIVVRDKESKVPLDRELEGSHALLTHGSIAAVEAAVLGYPVFCRFVEYGGARRVALFRPDRISGATAAGTMAAQSRLFAIY